MSQMLRHLLVDGALLRGQAVLATLQQSTRAQALYGDLGADAAAVGPWLWPDSGLSDLGMLDLPARHGVSEIHSDAPIQDLLAHFSRIRHVETHDAQRYFLRYADMRSLNAIRTAVDPVQWHNLMGPLARWEYVDRYGIPCALVPAAAPPSSPAPQQLRLSAAQLSALLVAGLADQLCLAVEELEDAALHPQTDPAQFASVEAAARLITREQIEPFVLQRAIARQAVLHSAECIESAEFMAAIRTARSTGRVDAVDAWSPSAQASRRRPSS